MVLGHDILTSERTQDIRISKDVSFESMLLSPQTLAGLKTSGFYVPSPIQLHGIPLGKCGFDLLLEAKSGTGKTAVFSIIALEKLNLDKDVQSLILAPTREIASQICDVVKTIGAYYKGLCVEVVMGGLPFADDVEKFKKKVHIVVGSPGRLHYLIKGKHIDVSSVRLMVLDEADKLVEKSFLPDINYIFSVLPSQKQIIMSSATYAEDVRSIIQKYVVNAQHICPESNSILLGIKQSVLIVPSHVNIVKQTKNRYDELNQILSKKQFKQCLIFCNYQARVCDIHRMLNKDKWPADKLHGQQEQTDRLEALKILQSYQCRILVTTDLTARGIDASNVDLVINFEPPHNWQTYLHRIGRAGRFGSYGSAITILCNGEEENKFRKILESINISFDLTYLWSNKPYILKRNIDEEMNSKKEEMQLKEQPNNNKPGQKLGVKETYEELWKMLSVDTIDGKDMHEIPTFESLNNSFNEEGQSNVNEIESFSDLLSSFQNHELKNNVLPEYKPVEVNKLIRPSAIFNRNQVLQNLLGKCDTKAAKAVEDRKEVINYEKLNSFIRKESIDDKNTISNNNGIIESGSNKDNKTCSKNLKSKNNILEGCCKDIYSETSLSASDIPTSGSSNINKPRTLKNGLKSHCINATVQNVQNSNMKNIYYNNRNKDISGNETDFISNDGEFDHNSKETNNQTEYNEDEKLLIAANLPSTFGKIKQKKSKKSKKHSVSFYESHTRSCNGIHKAQQQGTSVSHKEETVDSSSENENTKDAIDRSKHWKAYSNKSRRELNTRIRNQQSYECSDRDIDDKHQQFQVWYQQLHFYRQMIEQYVYIQTMTSSNF